MPDIIEKMDNRNSNHRSRSGAKKEGFKKGAAGKPERRFDKKEGDRKNFDGKPKRDFGGDSKKPPFGKPERRFDDKGERKHFDDKPKRSFGGDNKKPSFGKPERRFDNKPKRDFGGDTFEGEKPKKKFADRGERAKHYANKNEKSELKRGSFERGERAPYNPNKAKNYKKDYSKQKVTNAEKGLTRLNKYIANAGICSRREADDLIKSGCVTVNGKVVTELGFTVKANDEVNYSGARIKTEKHVYLLLNKPKDYITTAADERGRKTVMELVGDACKERIYPVGRLDRNTTGLLLFTNDGELTKKLTHPKHEVEKLYHVELDKNLKQDDFIKIKEGVELEDGFIKPDEIAYTGETKREVGIKIHSGRNRIVRRTFEHFGYDVLRLDRVMFAGLTKKNLPRAKWRFLTDKEVAFLKMLK